MIDLRTAKEKERDERDERICREFKTISQQAPGASAGRIALAIGDRVGMTRMGVLKVLTRKGLYTPRTKQDNQ